MAYQQSYSTEMFDNHINLFVTRFTEILPEPTDLVAQHYIEYADYYNSLPKPMDLDACNNQVFPNLYFGKNIEENVEETTEETTEENDIVYIEKLSDILIRCRTEADEITKTEADVGIIDGE